MAFAALMGGTYSCNNANGAEAQVEETGVTMEQDAKTLADLTCKIFDMMMTEGAVNADGTPSAAFEKISNEATKMQNDMEAKYTKESGEWAKFEKMTQDLVDKCGK